MKMKKTIGNEGVKHNIKFEEQNNGIIKGVKWKFLLERSRGSLSLEVWTFFVNSKHLLKCVLKPSSAFLKD